MAAAYTSFTLSSLRTLAQKDSEAYQQACKAIFDEVCDQEDWRAPIRWRGDATIAQVAVICHAITFFTATTPTVQELCSGGFLVKSEGYRNGPAGP